MYGFPRLCHVQKGLKAMTETGIVFLVDPIVIDGKFHLAEVDDAIRPVDKHIDLAATAGLVTGIRPR